MSLPPRRALALPLAWLLVACSAPGSAVSGPAAVGQRIFDDGVGPDGQALARTGGIGMMSGAGCAACHGSDGRGSQTMMFSAPNITYPI